MREPTARPMTAPPTPQPDGEGERRVVTYDPVAVGDAGCLRTVMTLKPGGLDARGFAKTVLATCDCLRAIERDMTKQPKARGLQWKIVEMGVEGNKAYFVLWDGVVRHPEKCVPVEAEEATDGE